MATDLLRELSCSGVAGENAFEGDEDIFVEVVQISLLFHQIFLLIYLST